MSEGKKGLNFEAAMERLKKVVEEMEKKDLSLDDSIKLFKEGMELSAFCNKKLDEAERKIKILTKGLDGNLEEEDFDPEDEK